MAPRKARGQYFAILPALFYPQEQKKQKKKHTTHDLTDNRSTALERYDTAINLSNIIILREADWRRTPLPVTNKKKCFFLSSDQGI